MMDVPTNWDTALFDCAVSFQAERMTSNQSRSAIGMTVDLNNTTLPSMKMDSHLEADAANSSPSLPKPLRPKELAGLLTNRADNTQSPNVDTTASRSALEETKRNRLFLRRRVQVLETQNTRLKHAIQSLLFCKESLLKLIRYKFESDICSKP